MAVNLSLVLTSIYVHFPRILLEKPVTLTAKQRLDKAITLVLTRSYEFSSSGIPFATLPLSPNNFDRVSCREAGRSPVKLGKARISPTGQNPLIDNLGRVLSGSHVPGFHGSGGR